MIQCSIAASEQAGSTAGLPGSCLFGLENLHGWRLHSLSGQTVPMFSYPHGKETFFSAQMEFHVLQFVSMCYHPARCWTGSNEVVTYLFCTLIPCTDVSHQSRVQGSSPLLATFHFMLTRRMLIFSAARVHSLIKNVGKKHTTLLP